MRTKGRIEGDTGYPDGQIFLGADSLNSVGTLTYTRTGLGLWNKAVAASTTIAVHAGLDRLLFRYGLQDFMFQQYGSNLAGPYGSSGLPVAGFTTYVTTTSGTGTNVNVAVSQSANFVVGHAVKAGTVTTYITAIPDGTHLTLASVPSAITAGTFITENLFTTPADVTGVPPYTGTTQFTPVTSPRPKGIRIRQIYPVYSISTANATTNTITLTRTVFANNVAPVVTTIVNAAALQTATNAQPYITPVILPAPLTFQTSRYAQYDLEWNIVTPASSTMNLYGIVLDAEFLYV